MYIPFCYHQLVIATASSSAELALDRGVLSVADWTDGSAVIEIPLFHASLATDAGRRTPRYIFRVRIRQDGGPEEACRREQ